MQPSAEPSIHLRPARPDDVTAIGGLVRELQREMGMPEQFDETRLPPMLNTPDSGILLALAEGVIAGLLSYNVCPGLLHGGASFCIEDVVVGARFRRRGIARALIAEAERLASRLGCVELEVTTLADNLPAQDLYRSAGFIGGALLMEKDLLDELGAE